MQDYRALSLSRERERERDTQRTKPIHSCCQNHTRDLPGNATDTTTSSKIKEQKKKNHQHGTAQHTSRAATYIVELRGAYFFKPSMYYRRRLDCPSRVGRIRVSGIVVATPIHSSAGFPKSRNAARPLLRTDPLVRSFGPWDISSSETEPVAQCCPSQDPGEPESECVLLRLCLPSFCFCFCCSLARPVSRSLTARGPPPNGAPAGPGAPPGSGS